MSEAQEIPNGIMADAAKDVFNGVKKGIWGIEESTWGYSISKEIPTRDRFVALIQCGLDYYKARGAELKSDHKSFTEEYKNEVELTKYERALGYVNGERRDSQSYLSILHDLGEEEIGWVKKELGKRPTILPGNKRDVQQIANNQLPLAAERVKLVLRQAQNMFEFPEPPEGSSTPGIGAKKP